MVSLVHEALPDGLSVRKRRMGDIRMNALRHQPTFGAKHDRACRIQRSSQQVRARTSCLSDPTRARGREILSLHTRGSCPAQTPSRPRGLLCEQDLSDLRCRYCGSRRLYANNRLNFSTLYCRKPGTSCWRAWGHGTVGWLRRPESTVGTSALYRTCRSSMISA